MNITMLSSREMFSSQLLKKEKVNKTFFSIGFFFFKVNSAFGLLRDQNPSFARSGHCSSHSSWAVRTRGRSCGSCALSHPAPAFSRECGVIVLSTRKTQTQKLQSSYCLELGGVYLSWDISFEKASILN